MTRVLFLDSSTRGRLVWGVAERTGGAWEAVAAAIDEAPLDTGLPARLAALDLRALEAVVVSLGPGSYTGVRAGVAAALGLASSTGIPVHGCSSLEVLAAGAAPGHAAVYAAVDAGRGGLYVARVELHAVTGLPARSGAPRRLDATAVVHPPSEPMVTLDAVDLRRAVAGAVELGMSRPALDPAHVETLMVAHGRVADARV